MTALVTGSGMSQGHHPQGSRALSGCGPRETTSGSPIPDSGPFCLWIPVLIPDFLGL